MMNQVINALTIDVEEHFQVHAFETVIDRSTWESQPSRVVTNTRRLLHLLADYEVRATFFVLGWVAERYPALVREVLTAGHEVATHGYWHELVYRQSPQEFTADLRRSLDALERAAGRSTVAGYRAPGFSITNQSLWALPILRDHGMRYDSSIFPLVAHDRYGIRGAARFAHKVDGNLWEFPVSTITLAKQNWPVAGGGYFRLFPLPITRRAIRRLNTQGQPAVVYLHPWEIDPHQPRIPDAPLLSRFRHYVNIARTEGRLRTLLQDFRFGPISEVFVSHLEAV